MARSFPHAIACVSSWLPHEDDAFVAVRFSFFLPSCSASAPSPPTHHLSPPHPSDTATSTDAFRIPETFHKISSPYLTRPCLLDGLDNVITSAMLPERSAFLLPSQLTQHTSILSVLFCIA
ncbi:hypothetical protein K458DRAFT_113752 [Lentithecium fluviatile CBS 122367]|uniref:Uncharacterized protein n=1 Tax=Lentithecium fluviatile CBS 122367 TaxID=1168545 RepID=A0A6G1IPE5_9PLEO|nr:hypothetical protein K458DRAFT_113752 [Lentithecium fluviatile CBS 122367]